MNAPVDRSHRGTILLEDATVVTVTAHAAGQTSLRLRAPGIAARCAPGVFVHLRCEPRLAMRRPMSVMRVDRDAGTFDILFKTHGTGTEALAHRAAGETLSVLGPIGRPFRLARYRPRPLLIGGGVGIPPMIYLADHLRRIDGVTPLVLMGSEIPFPFTPQPSRILVPGVPAPVIAAMPLLEDWGIASRLASQQGFAGCFEGFVTELAAHWIAQSGAAREDIEIFACGPTPMLKAVQQVAARCGVPAEISLEEYMACAVGGCAGCTVRIETPAGPAMKRVCVDGPVFDAAAVVLP
ncbi:MAG: dihydroorotate dehydrogenase electron transfer subunit [Gammaproteobacteria bacterium]